MWTVTTDQILNILFEFPRSHIFDVLLVGDPEYWYQAFVKAQNPDCWLPTLFESKRWLLFFFSTQVEDAF